MTLKEQYKILTNLLDKLPSNKKYKDLKIIVYNTSNKQTKKL
jgi:hypothetical protein